MEIIDYEKFDQVPDYFSESRKKEKKENRSNYENFTQWKIQLYLYETSASVVNAR